jgi:hypothetical protein
VDFPGGFIKAAGMITQDIEIKRLSVSELSKRFKSKSGSNEFITLVDVDAFLQDPQSVIWSPFELQHYCWHLARMSAYTEPFILAMQLMMEFNRIEIVRQWGSFLLSVAYDMVLPITDTDRCERLLDAIMYSEKAVPSLKAAAEDIAAALPSHDGQLPMIVDEHAGERKICEEHSEPVEGSKTLADAAPTRSDKEEKPRWDKDRGTLSYKGQLVKEFNSPAEHQRCVLSAFEEEGWPLKIDDPICPEGDVPPKERLSNTVGSLNKYHRTPNLIYFKADGTGTGICWYSGRKPSPKHDD